MEFRPMIAVAVLLLSVAALDGKPYGVNVATLSMDQAIERLVPTIAIAAEDVALECVEDVNDQTDVALEDIASSHKPLIDRMRQIVKTSNNPTQKAEEAKTKMMALAKEKVETSITEDVCDDADLLRSRRKNKQRKPRPDKQNDRKKPNFEDKIVNVGKGLRNDFRDIAKDVAVNVATSIVEKKLLGETDDNNTTQQTDNE